MIGTTGGAVLVVVSILFAGLLGLAAGWLTCLVLRRPWCLRDGAIDSGVAVAVLIIATFVEMKVETARGIWESHEVLILFIAGGSAAARELLRLIRR